MPTPEQLAKLKEYEGDYDNLAEAEQFAISLADIKRSVLIPQMLFFNRNLPGLFLALSL